MDNRISTPKRTKPLPQPPARPAWPRKVRAEIAIKGIRRASSITARASADRRNRPLPTLGALLIRSFQPAGGGDRESSRRQPLRGVRGMVLEDWRRQRGCRQGWR